jgi:hypothetical protein
MGNCGNRPEDRGWKAVKLLDPTKVNSPQEIESESC